MNKLYYTVEICTVDHGAYYEELSGTKVINLYKIEDNMPKLMAEISTDLGKGSEEEIQWWLDNEGVEEECEFEKL